ncbi:MAG TPA: hypothetical protein VGE52_08470, partial [Pirellulales bacterium]
MRNLVIVAAFFLGVALAIPLLPFIHKSTYRDAQGQLNQFGLREGPWVFYYSGDNREKQGEFQNGVPVGKWTFWHENGNKK